MIPKNIDLNNKVILVTGAAGFIGANLVETLLANYSNVTIVGIDNMNEYYDVSLKEYRIKKIEDNLDENKNVNLNENKDVNLGENKWIFIQGDISDKSFVEDVFKQYKPAVVVNLAAQAGVRHSIENPDVYIMSNIVGFYNIIEACRKSSIENIYNNIGNNGGHKGSIEDRITIKENKTIYNGVEHLIYASSSSIYGNNEKVPYSVDDKVDNPVSLYAATKKSNELIAHAYSKLYNIPCTGLRFFTVYGPAGRPDMAYFSFVDKLRQGEKIQVFNYGNCKRDFTYIDDIVTGVIKVMETVPDKKLGEDGLPIPPYRLYNIGNSKPVKLLDFIDVLCEECIRVGILEKDFNVDEYKELVAMQKGDVEVTYADTSALEEDIGYKPTTDIREGIRGFIEWYKGYYIG